MGSRENSKQVQTSINLIFGALVRIHYLASTYCFITTKMLVVETETRCNWYWAGFLSSNTIILLHPNKMTLYSNRVLSCCSAWIAKVQSVTLLFLFSYGTISLSSDQAQKETNFSKAIKLSLAYNFISQSVVPISICL